MACESGCCGPKDQELVVTNPEPLVAPTQSDGERDNCCDDEGSCAEPGGTKDDTRNTKTEEEKDSLNACCDSDSNLKKSEVKDTCHEGCCASAGTAQHVADEQVDDSCPAPNRGFKTDDFNLVDVCCTSDRKTEEDCVEGCYDPTAETQVAKTCGANVGVSMDDCGAKTTAKEDCKKGCCGSNNEAKMVGGSCGTKKNDSIDDCCAPKPLPDTDCKEGCCATVTPAKTQEEKVPSCCEGKTSPCCDSSCIDRLALRECAGRKPSTSNNKSKTSFDTGDCTGGKDGKPCRGHVRTMRETYQSKLEALGCICRALLALGQESCCAPRERSYTEGKRSSIKSSRSRTSVDSCCASGASKTACGSKVRPRVRSPRQASPILNSSGCADACCSKPKAPSLAGSCADACCVGKESAGDVVELSTQTVKNSTNAVDPEKGISGREHVVLSITGMTCTGCETKLRRTFATVGAVKNLKTSLVLARAEFDLNLSAGSVVDVIKHLERTTEFKCEKITSQGSSIDLIAPGSPEDFINQPWPEGVTDIRIVDKTTVHVDFDGEVVGARHLVEKGWSTPMNLAPLRADPTLEAGSKHVRNMGLITILSIILTIPVLVMAWAPLPEREIAYGSSSLALATIVQVVIAGPFYPKALKSLIFSKVIEMDLLIVLSTSAAYIFSVVSFGYLVSHKPLSTGEFFETSTLLVTLIMVGRYVSALARQKAVESISIRSLQVSTALIIDASGEEKEIDARLLQYGDVFKVVPDSRVPTDGTIISGSSDVDESMMTGESKTIEKHAGCSVIAGSINGAGTISVRLTRLPGENTISNIAGMVDEAKLSKPKIQDVADRVASYFVPVVVALTIITFLTWVAVGVAVRKQSGSEATIQAITYAITVLIVSCPCAIGLAVPMVIVIASGVAAERGVIFKSADSIEVAYKTSHVVFDKTGTITNGKLAVVQEQYFTDDTKATRALLLGLVGSIKHPVSAGVAAHLKAVGISATAVSDPKTLTGKGVEAMISGCQLRAGNSRWLGLCSDPRVEPILSKGYTAFCFTVDDSLAAVFGLEDSIRSDAVETIAKLQSSGVSVHIISGDDDGAVRAVATQLSIPDVNIRSRCTPADKQEYIQRLLSTTVSNNSSKSPSSSKEPVVIFCGDGTNDAVALAQATIGVHMNEGTDVAKSAADVVLMRPSLAGILTIISISKKAVHRIAFNFGWSFVYNLFAILLGAGAFVKVRIPPEFAGLGELASVLPVIAAAVLLRWSKV